MKALTFCTTVLTLTLFAAIDVSSAMAQSRKPFGLLYEGTYTQPWRHRGHASWGANWHRVAMAEALREARTRVNQMVNLAQLEAYSHKALFESIDADYVQEEEGGYVAITSSHGKDEEEMIRWVNRNHLLVDVSNIRIQPRSDWSRTQRDLWGRRTWEASAIMVLTLRIYGRADEPHSHTGFVTFGSPITDIRQFHRGLVTVKTYGGGYVGPPRHTETREWRLASTGHDREPTANEVFEMRNNGDGTFSLLSLKTRRLVTALHGGNNTLRAAFTDRRLDNPGAWERFRILTGPETGTLRSGEVAIGVHDGHCWWAEHGGDRTHQVNAQGNPRSGWSHFRILRVEDRGTAR